MLPNLKHFRYLIALHKHQHFNKAALACFVSQSTLSSAILKLEEQLECQLIERDHKNFIFTFAGEKVVEMARQLLFSANELVDYAKQKGAKNSGSIRVGCIPTIAPFLLTDLVQKCQLQLPDLALYLSEDTTENLILQLSQGDIDLAILAFPLAQIEQYNFKQKLLGKDAFYIAGDRALVKDFQQNKSYDKLPKQSVFLLNKEHCLTEHAISACQLADATKINDFSASSLATLVQMTAFHHGITFLPAMAVHKGLGNAEKLVIERMQDEVYRDIGMLWRATSMRQQVFMQLGEIVQSLCD